MPLKELIETCSKETGVPSEELQQFLDSEMDPAEATNGIKCHMKCVLEKIGLYKNNMLDEALTIKFFKDNNKDQPVDVEALKQSVQNCNQKKGVDPCDTAFQIAKCFMSQHPIFN